MEVITDFKITCGKDISDALYRIDKEFYVPVKRFKDDHVFDEDKSVKWNREEVIRQNEKQRELQHQAREMCAKSNAALLEAIYKYIMTEATYEYSFTREEAAVIWAQTQKHHDQEPWNWVDDMAESAGEFYKVYERGQK